MLKKGQSIWKCEQKCAEFESILKMGFWKKVIACDYRAH